MRLYCYIQKVWFDNLSVVELPVSAEIAIEDSAIAECSTSPAFSLDTTRRFDAKETLPNGLWFVHTGLLDQHGLPCWLSERSIRVGPDPWRERDTTPPVVNLPLPLPGATVEPQPIITAALADAGSGIDVSSAKIVLDGEDLSSHANVTQNGLTLKPPRPLAKGVHKVEVTIADNAGNRSNRLTWRFGVAAVPLLETKFQNGRLLVNDEPYFPVGIYTSTCMPGDEGRFSESALAEATAAGFDCLLNTVIKPEQLPMLQQHRIRNLATVYYEMQEIRDAASAEAALIAEGQARYISKHPTTLGYWVEPEYDPKYLLNMVEAGKVLRKYDPAHLFIYCGSVDRRWKEFMDATDIVIAYRYPIPRYHPIMIYGWTLALAYQVAEDKPVWFLPQAFSFELLGRIRNREPVSQDQFRPTAAEMRVMVYFSLVMGVKGLGYYALHLPHPSLSSVWDEVLKEAAELRYLAPVLAAGKEVRTVSLRKDSSYGSVYFREIEYDGTHTLIAVNMSAGRVAATWNFDKAVQAAVLFEDRAMPEESDQMTDLFDPFEVHIYRWK